MPLVESLTGPTRQYVVGTTYEFAQDSAGRAVANIRNERHLAIVLSAGTYRVVEEAAAPPPVAPAPVSEAPASPPPPAPESRAAAEAVADATASAALKRARAPQILRREIGGLALYFAAEPWPKFTAADPADFDEEQMPFLALDPATGNLDLIVENGRALYLPLGKVGAETVYAIDDVSEWRPLPPDEDEEPPPVVPAPALIDIKGIGKKLVERLAGEGIETIADLLALDPEGLVALEAKLGLNGVIARQRWIEQAEALVGTAGD